MSGPEVLVCPSVKIRYSTCSTLVRRATRSAPCGSSKVASVLAIVAFARLMRCAIVDSGTKNALAISVVFSPPTARSVSAICEAGVNAG